MRGMGVGNEALAEDKENFALISKGSKAKGKKG